MGEEQTQIAGMLGEGRLKLNESILLRRQICGNALAAAPQYDIINFRYPIAGAKPGAATLGAESVFPERRLNSRLRRMVAEPVWVQHSHYRGLTAIDSYSGP